MAAGCGQVGCGDFHARGRYRCGYTALRDAVFAHPTLAESLNNLFASLEG